MIFVVWSFVLANRRHYSSSITDLSRLTLYIGILSPLLKWVNWHTTVASPSNSVPGYKFQPLEMKLLW